jgi:hypothetical protein
VDVDDGVTDVVEMDVVVLVEVDVLVLETVEVVDDTAVVEVVWVVMDDDVDVVVTATLLLLTRTYVPIAATAMMMITTATSSAVPIPLLTSFTSYEQASRYLQIGGCIWEVVCHRGGASHVSTSISTSIGLRQAPARPPC